jgi:hypothetical protein
MTEPAGMNAVSIVTPIRSRTHRVKKHGTKNLETVALAKQLSPFLVSLLDQSLTPIIRDLRTRLAEAERKHQELAQTISDEVFRFRGTWRQDKTYARGSVVVHSGSLWFALETNDVRPGTSGDWQLTVKQGAFSDRRRGDR